MKHVPLIYPLSLALIVVVMFFAGVWSIAESAVNGNDIIAVESAVTTGPSRVSAAPPPATKDWYEKAAIFICPLH